MALPNLNKPSRVEGKNATLALTGSAQAIVSNAASSGKSVRVVSLYVANVDGVDDASVTADIYNGTATRYIVKTVAVPADATLSLITREDLIYLNEGDSLRLSASADEDLEAIVSYEEIS
jgi:hypothetical protein